MKCFMGKEARRGLPTAHCWFLPASQTFSFTIFPTLNLFWFRLSIFRHHKSNFLSQVSRTPWLCPVLPWMWGALLLGSLSLCQQELHCTSPFPFNHTPNLPFQNNVQLEEVGSHIALFFGKEKTGSFYLHRRDFAELPSGEKKKQNASETQRIWEPSVLPVCKSQFCSLPVSRARDAAAPSLSQPRLLWDPNSSAAPVGLVPGSARLPKKKYPRNRMLRSPTHQ